MAIPGVSLLWQLARRVEKVFEEVDNANRGLAKLRDELHELEKRVTALEGREELLVEKTRTAASVAASSAVTIHLVDMSRRIGALEAGQGTPRRIE
jgi:predicted  nucleic acid-binding Zn-ribbon protein